MFCKSCGAQIDDTAKFCTNCGAAVEIEAQSNQSQEVPFQDVQVDYQQSQFQPAPAANKNKLVAGLLGILLGSLGIHKFYLGYTKSALIMLLVSILLCWTGVAPAAMGVIGLVEGILYLTKTDEEFYNTYEANEKQWF